MPLTPEKDQILTLNAAHETPSNAHFLIASLGQAHVSTFVCMLTQDITANVSLLSLGIAFVLMLTLTPTNTNRPQTSSSYNLLELNAIASCTNNNRICTNPQNSCSSQHVNRTLVCNEDHFHTMHMLMRRKYACLKA
jgi:hypothetical protein